MNDPDQTNPAPAPFDFDAFPMDTLFHDRRGGRDRRRAGSKGGDPAAEGLPRPPAERRAKKERRRRIDPTTFEKQYAPRPTAPRPTALSAMERARTHQWFHA